MPFNAYVSIEIMPFNSEVGRIMGDQQIFFSDRRSHSDFITDKEGIAYLYSCLFLNGQYHEANRIMRFVNRTHRQIAARNEQRELQRIEVDNDSAISE